MSLNSSKLIFQFINHMNELEVLFHDIDRWKFRNDISCIALNAARHAYLIRESMAFDELLVQIDLNCINFVYDSAFTSLCIESTMTYIDECAQYLPKLIIEQEYVKPVKHFAMMLQKLQIHSTFV